MGKHFSKIRRKTRLWALITAVIIALGVGTVAVSAILAFLKLTAVPLPLWAYIACGATVPIAFVLSFLLFKPSDRRLAKRLDDEHGLDEKIRTMVEFKSSEDEFARLQREDADEKLGALKVRAWRKKQIVSIVLVVVISVAAFTVASLVPEKQEPVPVEPPLSDFDKQWILAELADLIATVDKSLMTEQLKAASLSELNRMVEFVKTHDYMSEMKNEAVSVVISINGALYTINTSPRIGENLVTSQTELLAKLGGELVNMSGSKAKEHLEDLKKSIEDGSVDASFASDELSAAINASGTDKDNVLVSKLSNLASALKGYSNETLTLDAAFGSLPFEMSNEVMIQNINKMTTQTVISKLCSIFGISPEDLAGVEGGANIDTRPPQEVAPDEEEPPEVEEPDEPIGSGGMGTGDRVYGSNDIIYDPYSNTYVTYGQLLDEYNAKATDKIIDGQITEDFAKFIEEYFKNLSEYTPPEA